MAALFALDQNFPQPLVQAVAPFIPEVELVPIRNIDVRLSDMDDWEILLALHHHAQDWDGLVTTDSSMLNQARELAVVHQLNATLVIAHDAGHDPIKATGLLLAHLDYIAARTSRSEPQIWRLTANNRPGHDPWEFLERVARHQHLDVDTVWRDSRLNAAELRANPLGD
ncbi:MAG: hypothetical protein ACR2FF_05065 [Mycobacteriales bacterium]